jgi:hypothetical protein
MLHSILALALVAQITTSDEPPQASDDTIVWSMLYGGGGAIAGLAVGVGVATLGSAIPGAFLAPVILAAVGASLAGVPSSSEWVAGVAAASTVGGMLVGGAALGATGFAVGWLLLANRPPPPPGATEDFSGLLIIALTGVGATAGAVIGAPVGAALGAGITDAFEE